MVKKRYSLNPNQKALSHKTKNLNLKINNKSLNTLLKQNKYTYKDKKAILNLINNKYYNKDNPINLKNNHKKIVKKLIFIFTFKESVAIINYLKNINDMELLLVYYFIYIKGLNFTDVSRILITNFKNGFNYLLIKKGKTKKIKIDKIIHSKLLEYIHSQEYDNKYLFFNKIKDTKTVRRASFIKNKFKNVIEECSSIKMERKEKLMKYLSSKRGVKWGFNLDFFINDIGYTFGYFEPSLSIFSKQDLINNTKYLLNDSSSDIEANAPFQMEFQINNKKEGLSNLNEFGEVKINLLKKLENKEFLQNIFEPSPFHSQTFTELKKNSISNNKIIISPLNSINDSDN